MVELSVPASFIPYAEACMDFMSKVKNADEIKNWDGFDYELYVEVDERPEEEDDEHLTVDGTVYGVFEPEYRLAGCDVRIDRYGDIKVELPFKHTPEKIWFSIGTLDELKSRFEQAQQEEHAAKPKMGM
jgi:hypothetical protein